MKRPITIAGGGLAGLGLGIALRRAGVDVTLHEAGNYPRHRVCGEFISGVSDATLARLGVLPELADAERLETAEWHDACGTIGRMRVRACGISRYLLDERLRVRFEEAGGRLCVRSRIAPGEGVIWAAGRPSRKGKWIGLKCHARGLALTSDLEMAVAWNGYVGLARIGNGLVNVCGLFRAGSPAPGKGPALLLAMLRAGGLGTLSERLGKAELMTSSFCGVAGFRPGSQPGPPFSIGDAAQMIPPFTGNGMSMAFESADLALEPALAYADGRMDWESAAAQVATAQKKRFRRRMMASRFFHCFLTQPAGIRFATILGRRSLLPFDRLLSLVR